MKIATASYPLDHFQEWQGYADKITHWVEQAISADLIVFPEYGAMELAGLNGAVNAADLIAAAGSVSDWIDRADALHVDLARKTGSHILAGSGPVRDGGDFVNRARLFSPDGQVGIQDKVIMTPYERKVWGITPRNALSVFDTHLGRIGVLICYDSEFPDLARHMVEAGLDILLVPSCTDTPQGYWRVRTAVQARALEAQCVVVQSSTVGPTKWCDAVDQNFGMAGVFVPPDVGMPEDGIIAIGQMNQPGWVFADVDLEKVNAIRTEGHVRVRAHWPEQERCRQATLRKL